MFLLLYYLNKINNVENQFPKDKKLSVDEWDTDKNISSLKISDEERKKYNEIFKKIMFYMESKEPYKNPNFTLSELASAITSNQSYISKAIKLNGYQNFNAFLNYYRIKFIKDQILLKKYTLFTLRYIYTEAGFTHQSTFNRAFKELEGITPSQYISSHTEESKSE